MTREDLGKIIEIILKRKGRSCWGYCKLRDATIMLLMFYNGLRPREACRAKLDHLDIKKALLYIPGKDNKQRQSDSVYLADFVWELLYKYLEIRNIHPQASKSEWLFPNIMGGPIDRSTVMTVFKKAIKEAGLYKLSYIDKQGKPRGNLTLYSLRHSFATNAYLKLHDLRKVATLLRHKDFQCRSTLRYIHSAEGISYKELIEEVYKPEIPEINDKTKR